MCSKQKLMRKIELVKSPHIELGFTLQPIFKEILSPKKAASKHFLNPRVLTWSEYEVVKTNSESEA